MNFLYYIEDLTLSKLVRLPCLSFVRLCSIFEEQEHYNWKLFLPRNSVVYAIDLEQRSACSDAAHSLQLYRPSKVPLIKGQANTAWEPSNLLNIFFAPPPPLKYISVITSPRPHFLFFLSFFQKLRLIFILSFHLHLDLRAVFLSQFLAVTVYAVLISVLHAHL
jgi:hypothetical protein